MEALEILTAEHRVIETVLGALEDAVRKSRGGHPVAPRLFLEAADFMREYADRLHHGKEEDLLFEKMVERGFSRSEGPLAVMLAEHEQGRALARAMAEAAARWQDGDESAREVVLTNAGRYAELLRAHILKEDNVLYPMARRMLTSAALQALGESFKRIEAEARRQGTQEKYTRLAESLGKER